MSQFMSESNLHNHPYRFLPERSTPRRQASIIVSINEGTVNVPPHTQTHITDSAITRSPNPVAASARRVTNEINEIITSTDDAWRTIEEALAEQARVANRATTSHPPASDNNRRIRQLTQMRERLRNTRQPIIEPYEVSLGLRRTSRSTHDASKGVRTAGLAMSPDGRTLYCGTEEGIFEFKMNLHVRKAFPAIHPR
jgi:transcriptional regulator of acetoin/glycerol metabolism